MSSCQPGHWYLKRNEWTDFVWTGLDIDQSLTKLYVMCRLKKNKLYPIVSLVRSVSASKPSLSNNGTRISVLTVKTILGY